MGEVVKGQPAKRVRVTHKTHKALESLRDAVGAENLNEAISLLAPYAKDAIRHHKAMKRKKLTDKLRRAKAQLAKIEAR